MKILWFTWKDLNHPQAGGAELINEEIARRLAGEGQELILIVSGFPGGLPEETRNGYKIVRLGNRYSVYWKAYRYYTRYYRGWADIVIDEMNTMPFFCKFYVKERNILLAYQLCREVWFYQMPFPMSLLGYMIEPFYLKLLNDRDVITQSESTKNDMLKYGFDSAHIAIMKIGIGIMPAVDIDQTDKFKNPTMLSLGALRKMKRTVDQIRAFEIAKKSMPTLRFMIAGSASGGYGQKVLRLIKQSPFAEDIEYLGFVDESTKVELMRKCHAILVTSVKEGWGLIVTEANSQGTPAIVYNVDGLRDSVRHEETGIICRGNNPQSLADAAVNLLSDQPKYHRIRMNAWHWSRELTFDRCFEDFMRGIAEK